MFFEMESNWRITWSRKYNLNSLLAILNTICFREFGSGLLSLRIFWNAVNRSFAASSFCLREVGHAMSSADTLLMCWMYVSPSCPPNCVVMDEKSDANRMKSSLYSFDVCLISESVNFMGAIDGMA